MTGFLIEDFRKMLQDRLSKEGELISLAEGFDGVGEVQEIHPLAGGHINDSRLIKAVTGDFVLQRINLQVLTNVEQLMRNISTVAAHLCSRGFAFSMPDFLPFKGKQPWHYQANSYWRLYAYLPGLSFDADTLSAKQAPHMVYEAGRAFGTFAHSTSDLNADQMIVLLPGFHDLRARLDALQKSAATAKQNATDRWHKSEGAFNRLMTEGQSLIHRRHSIASLPARIVHNDAKLTNLLFNAEGDVTALLDFDTVMPGSLAYDFGDLVRSCADHAPEDAPDPAPPDEARLQALVAGYLAGVGKSVSVAECQALSWAPAYMTCLLAVRFLTDFLSLDVYFRTAYESHNLARALSQLQRLDYYLKDQAKLADLLAC